MIPHSRNFTSVPKDLWRKKSRLEQYRRCLSVKKRPSPIVKDIRKYNSQQWVNTNIYVFFMPRGCPFLSESCIIVVKQLTHCLTHPAKPQWLAFSALPTPTLSARRVKTRNHAEQIYRTGCRKQSRRQRSNFLSPSGKRLPRADGGKRHCGGFHDFFALPRRCTAGTGSSRY